MDVRELAAALETRGLGVKHEPHGVLKVSRPGAHGLLTETVRIEDGRPLWSWGSRVNGEDVAAVAALIDHVISPSEVSGATEGEPGVRA